MEILRPEVELQCAGAFMGLNISKIQICLSNATLNSHDYVVMRQQKPATRHECRSTVHVMAAAVAAPAPAEDAGGAAGTSPIHRKRKEKSAQDIGPLTKVEFQASDIMRHVVCQL
jgi:hypothetical protein